MPTLFVVVILAGIPRQAADVGASTSPSAAIKLAIEPFGYHGVSLDDGPLRQQCDSTREAYLRIPNDDLLKGFRQRARRPAPGTDLGGWYSSISFTSLARSSLAWPGFTQ